MYAFENQIIEVPIGKQILKVKLIAEKYRSTGNLAIMGVCEDGEPFATLTVNIPGAQLDEDEVVIKNWSENEEFARSALMSGFFMQWAMKIPTGHVNAPVWKVIRNEAVTP